MSAALAADKYVIDASHTSTEFSVRHLVISNVKGNFSDISGVIMYDENDATKSSVDVTIKVASINTNNEKRDDHLRSLEFFDAEKYPEITFKSKKIEKTDDGLKLVGTLTIRGVSKEVAFPFELTGKITDPWKNVRIGAEANLKINRQDFGVSWNNVMEGGGLVVGNDVKITINLEAVKQS
ncbi:MAG: polyisoprenoid-binding protein [Candidatus Latescibacteria bacterium]|nr:polyisoprenoid-binding protein [Candidatus Latescibacterota bacterium]NIO00986.1 polyisoprenoid-binding protein [Candidatus Latescibacterota bacterium]NIO27385.1 polyisoprenoid-binding protein [Candidatus Latescibacterota bacterium]NIO54907.1 polyisoprenoid-binding protein [Candidatus Latescibacterota bacterium]NIT00996.1 polyisoprenoid-binding protein [Candidatus Latescibacterota bacterium]